MATIRGFSFRDHVVNFTPEASFGTAVQGVDRRLLSGNKFSFDPGAGADHLPGFGELPFAVIRKANKPKWSAEGISADELRATTRHCGEIGGPPFTINIVVARPGAAVWHLRLKGCEFGEGAGWSVDDNGAMDKLGGPCLDILYGINGGALRSIYAKIHGR
jgi:hypothetical protein